MQKSVSLRRLLQLARPEWRTLAAGTAFLALASAMGLLYPQGIRLIIDGVLAGGQVALVDRAALLMVGAAVVQAVAIASRAYLFSTPGDRILAPLRADLYPSVLSQELAFFRQRRTRH